MSFDSGPGGYTPPPPKRGLSPWAWVGIGCGTITLLGVGGCVVIGFKFAKAFNSATSPEDSRKKLEAAQVPIYPNAQINEPATRGAGGFINLMGGMMGKGTSVSMVAFDSPDAGPKIQDWYVQKTTALGFSKRSDGERTSSAGRNSVQHMYGKGDEVIMVQTQDSTTNKQGSLLILAHFKGLDKNKSVNFR